MSLVKPTLIFDLINTLWIALIYGVLYIWLPVHSASAGSTKLNYNQIIGLYLRASFVAIAGVLLLSYFNLLNWLTLVFLFGTSLVFDYLESNSWQIKQCQQKAQDRLLSLVDVFDQGISLGHLYKDINQNYRQKKQGLTDYMSKVVKRQGLVFVVILTIVLGFAILLRWEYPLLDLRFSRPDSYGELLTVRQMLAGQYPQVNYLPAFPALAAMISLLGSTDAMQVLRFLSPLLGMVLVLSLGYLIWVLLENAAATLMAMLALGVYLFTAESLDNLDNLESLTWLTTIADSLNSGLVRQWTGNGLELGVIFVLLTLGYLYSSDRSPRQAIAGKAAFKVNCVCGIILVGLCAPPLLILMAIALIGLLGNKKLALTGIILTWILLAVFAALAQPQLPWTQNFLLTLPVPLSLLAGLLFAEVVEGIKLISEKWAEPFCLALVLALVCNFLLPLNPQLTYVEYDITARKALEISRLLPRNTWTLAAPIEQLSEIYGFGWHEDLASFVEKYAEQIEQIDQPEFSFSTGKTDLYVFVEKIPFVTFPGQLSILPNATLGDRTYRYYRSSSGRASLEFEALQLCEAYRQSHPESKIYFENEELRIYHFPAQA